MSIVPITGQGSIIDRRSPGPRLPRIFPSHLVIIILRIIEIPGPVCGPELAVQYGLQIGHRSIMQIRRRDPDPIQGRSDISVKGVKPCRMIPLRKPTLIEPFYKLRTLEIGLEKKRIRSDGGFGDQQIGIGAAIAIMPMTLAAILYKKCSALPGQDLV